MRIPVKKYFDLAKENQIDPFVLTFSSSTETSLSVENEEVQNQTIGTSIAIGGKGIFRGKQGSFATDSIDSKTPSNLISQIQESAKYGKKDKAENYYHHDLHIPYRKLKLVQDDFQDASLSDMKTFALELSQKVKALDKRIVKVFVDVSKDESETSKYNSYGVRYKEKAKIYSGSIMVMVEGRDKLTKSSSESFYSFHSLEDLEKEAEKKFTPLIAHAVDFLGAKSIPGKEYPAILSPSSFVSLFASFLSQMDAKTVQKGLSIFQKSLGKRVTGTALTVTHTPHTISPCATSYDSEGVPTQEFPFIQDGILKTYFYSVESSLKANGKTNGCACGSGYASPICLTVKEGTKNLCRLMEEMKDGLYITSITGLNSGIDSQTLDFSLPCEGYLIQNGKIERAVSMIVISGNLKDLFLNVKDIGNDICFSGFMFTPSVLFEKVSISGK